MSLETEETKRINCEICGSYVAKTSINIGGKKIALCQQDANLLLRFACLNEPDAVNRVIKFVEANVYDKE